MDTNGMVGYSEFTRLRRSDLLMKKKLHGLNVGCGSLDTPTGYDSIEWVRLDIRSDVNADVVWDLRKQPYPFNDEEFNYIYASHILEHFATFERTGFLRELRRILKPRGKLEVRIPCLLAAVKLWMEGDNYGLHMIYGSQSGEYEVHKWGYTKESLVSLLKNHGFNVVQAREVDGQVIATFTR